MLETQQWGLDKQCIINNQANQAPKIKAKAMDKAKINNDWSICQYNFNLN